MESRLLVLVIIMMIKIIPIVFIKCHRCSIDKILANSLQWLLWKDICGGNNLLFLRSLSLTTLQHYDIRAGFPADLFVLEKIGHLLYHL